MTKSFRVLFLSVFFIAACSNDNGGDDGGGETPDKTFDRGAMLANWADNIIIPAFEDFKSSTTALNQSAIQFIEEPTEGNLGDLRNAYLDAYLKFQNVSMFEIGKAETLSYRINLNTYPTDGPGMISHIEEGDYNLELPSSFDEQGFPALDFLLYGLAETDGEIVAIYSTSENAALYKDYLGEVAIKIDDLTKAVLDDWKGGFRDAFVGNTSSSNTGSVDKLANDYIFYFEKYLRAGKVGIPAGVFSATPLPQNVEAFYKRDISKQLLIRAISATQDFFNGKHFIGSATGESFKSYLDFLNTVKNGEDLSKLIDDQFSAAKEEANVLNDDFVQQIEADNNKMISVYEELQRNVILLKVDMLQALDISVDYVDADGD